MSDELRLKRPALEHSEPIRSFASFAAQAMPQPAPSESPAPGASRCTSKMARR